jgi:uncharacterized protein YceH (UPF0502 family)
METEPLELTAMQARVLGALMEKEKTTPDQYPLTLNALRNACNQKTARNPVVAFTEGQVGHTVRELEGLGFVREAWGARVAKYEHQAGKVLGLQSKGVALMCALMLRGPQTLGELRTNTQRLHEFDDLDDVHYMLQRLAEHEPPLVINLPRSPGQKETRYAHLLSGAPDPADYATAVATPAAPVDEELAARVTALEAEVAELRRELDALRDR